jgi:hypothetical protein
LQEDLQRRVVDEFDLGVRGLQETTGAIVQAVDRIRYIINGQRLPGIMRQMNQQQIIIIGRIINQRSLTEKRDRMQQLVLNQARAQQQLGMTAQESTEAQQLCA